MQEQASQLHDRIRKVVREHRRAKHTLARLFTSMEQQGLHVVLGYRSVQDYAWSEHDMKRRQVRDLLRLGRRLPDLPALDRTLASGELHWTKARAMLSVLTPENEAAWVDRARHSTVRQLEAQSSVSTPGAPPPDPRESRAAARVRMTLDVLAQDKQVIRDALAVVRAQTGDDGTLEDGELLAMICATYLAQVDGPERPTTSPHTIVVERCPDCERTHGVQAELAEPLASQVDCHAEIIDARPGPTQGRLTRSVAPRIERLVFHRASYECEVPGCCNGLWLHLHHVRPFSEGGGQTLDNLLCLCSAHHRLTHDGRLGVAREPDGRIRFELADGRILHARATHVGRPAA